MTALVLASSSPRRRALLEQIGFPPARIESPDIDETPLRGEAPRDYARRLAAAKALAVHRDPGEVIIAGDTTVATGRYIFPPADGASDVRCFLERLSGRRQRVLGAVAVIDRDGRIRQRLSVSIVAFKRLTSAEIDDYVQSGEGEGKAGGYAIQGRAAGFVKFLSGSYSGVVGLPLFEARALLIAAGVAPRPAEGNA